MSNPDISFQKLVLLTGNRLGTHDVPCPICSHLRKPANRKTPVLRIWHERPEFVSFFCAHCNAHGYAHSDDPFARRVDARQIAQLMRQADKAKLERVRKMRQLAQYLWARGIPIQGTVAERYLRSRGITRPLPATLRFLSASGQYPPAMIAPFGIPAEPIPGWLDVERMMIHGVHLTRLKPDGSGKTDADDAKKFIGSAPGMPIVLAPVNDIGGLGITEGIEDALSLQQATGLGAWAAGSANRLPGLARTVPQYADTITILVDDDADGRKYSNELARHIIKIRGSRLDVRLAEHSGWRAVA